MVDKSEKAKIALLQKILFAGCPKYFVVSHVGCWRVFDCEIHLCCLKISMKTEIRLAETFW